MSKPIPGVAIPGRNLSVSLPPRSMSMDSQDENLEASPATTQAQASQKADDRVWVACNRCDKWRALPSKVDVKDLPDVWLCEFNTYDPARASCDVEEEKYVQPDAPLKYFFKVWSKRIKSTDKAETRLPPSAVTRGRKRRLDVEWIRCSNATCGKWRAIALHGLDTSSMLRRLNRSARGGWNTKKTEWFCSMNAWDETRASCAAPQEHVWDCRWNLGS